LGREKEEGPNMASSPGGESPAKSLMGKKEGGQRMLFSAERCGGAEENKTSCPRKPMTKIVIGTNSTIHETGMSISIKGRLGTREGMGVHQNLKAGVPGHSEEWRRNKSISKF